MAECFSQIAYERQVASDWKCNSLRKASLSSNTESLEDVQRREEAFRNRQENETSQPINPNKHEDEEEEDEQ